MWILKGSLLGLWLFSFGTLAYFWKALGFFQGAVVDLRSLQRATIANPSWWLAFVICVALGLLVARNWPGKTFVWVSLAVTELLPLAYVAFIAVVVIRLKELMVKP